ncbi:MAG: AmmeMemoRadiSam system protein B [Acidobacteriota bacterium]|nr:MAG: AmmeMemoRadiSam system protein B [Acidobacteriota bacterium]
MSETNRGGRPPIARLALPLALLVILSLALAVLIGRGKGLWEDVLLENLPPADERRAPEPVSPRLPAPSIRVRNVRPAYAAGKFYPEDTEELFDMAGQMFSNAQFVGLKGCRAILVPHAGYVYSGEVAAVSFRQLDKNFRRAFILAANHSGEADFKGVSIPLVTHYAVPGAEVPLSDIAEELRADPLFTHEPLAHRDHMIELELPFLHLLRGQPDEPDFSIVPMILGRMDTEDSERLAEILHRYSDDETIFVFSVDLSHFFDDQRARNLDAYTIRSIMSQDRDALSRATTDGNHVLLTMLGLAERGGWEATNLGYRNSGDVSGDKSRVVGYTAITFHEPFSLSAEEQKLLLALAREGIGEYLESGRLKGPERTRLAQHPILRIPRGVFVTLEKNGRLRGCIGDLFPRGPLFESVLSCGVKSAVQDRRFSPVTREELDQLTISVSVLEFPRPVEVASPLDYLKVLRPGKDGVILLYRGGQSTFLPYVWKDISDPVEFLARLCQKQGAPPNCWRDRQAALLRYGAYEFSEKARRD